MVFLYFYKAYTKYLLAWTNEVVLSTGIKGLALHRLGSCYWQSIPYSRANLSPHCFASDPVFSNAPRKATQNCPSTWPPSHQYRRPGWHSGLLVLVWARSGCCSHLEREPVDGQFSLSVWLPLLLYFSNKGIIFEKVWARITWLSYTWNIGIFIK